MTGGDVTKAEQDRLDAMAAALARVVDAACSFTHGHSERVAGLAAEMAAELGLDPSAQRRLARGALLHDIGKLAIAPALLEKPGRLTEAEYAAMKTHALHSENILRSMTVFADLAPMAGAHHERLDGRGYPRGLVGDEIGLETRILSVADVFDALTSTRPYRPAMPVAEVLTLMAREIGTAFDPACFAALEAVLGRRASFRPDLPGL